MNKIILYGGGGHCHALIELIRATSEFDPILIVDKNPSVLSILGVPVQREFTISDENVAIAIAIGNNQVRKKVANKFNLEAPSFIHHSSVVYPSAVLGKGAQVLPNAVIDAAVTLGDFVIVNSNATVSHNATIGSYSHVAINAAIAGGCTIGEGVLIGAGSVVLPNVTIGDWATVGAGAIVTQDVPSGVTVVGNPAKIIKSTNEY